SGGSSKDGRPGTKASAMPAKSSRIAGAMLTLRAKSAVPASTASRIRNIWNLASTAFAIPPRLHWSGNRARSIWRSLFAQIVAVGFRDDLPAILQFHRHQIVGEISRRQLATRLDEGRVVVGAVDGDDEILTRLAFRLGRRPLPDPGQPIRHGENFQFALLHPAQVGRGVKHLAHLVGIAFVQGIEILLDRGFGGRSVVSHGVCSCLRLVFARHSGARAKRTSPESITTIGNMDSGPAPSGASRNDEEVTSRRRLCRRPACRTICRPPLPDRDANDG